MGLKAIKEAGGSVIVQSPREADFADMPESAIRYNDPIDLVAPIDVLATEICRLTGRKPELEMVIDQIG